MKIEKQCSAVSIPAVITIQDIPNGTVIRYGDKTQGPYLRVKHEQVDGLLNLERTLFYPAIGYAGFNFVGYTVLPNVKLVTGE